MQDERQGFIFYVSFAQMIDIIPDEKEQLKMFKAITNYSLYGIEPDFQEAILKVGWSAIKPQIDANQRRYENGKKGGRPAKNDIGEEAQKPKNNQTETKPKPKEKEKEKEKVNDKEKEINNIPSPLKNNGGVAVNSPAAAAAKFEEFRAEYPNRQGRAKARIYWSRIKPELYDKIIEAVRIYKSDKRETKYYKHASTRLFQQSWEDYTTITRDELKSEMDATRTRDIAKDGRYGQNLKPKYEAMFGEGRFDIRMQDKEEVKSKREALRKEHRLSHNGIDLPCPQQ